jgi:hypothetical protein
LTAIGGAGQGRDVPARAPINQTHAISLYKEGRKEGEMLKEGRVLKEGRIEKEGRMWKERRKDSEGRKDSEARMEGY